MTNLPEPADHRNLDHRDVNHRDLRVSDADRERAAEALRVAAGDGRITSKSWTNGSPPPTPRGPTASWPWSPRTCRPRADRRPEG